jgi:hypothetical protein
MSAVAIRHENAPAAQDMAEIVERVVIKGDLRPLSPKDRAEYYARVCESVGLNPLTRPFDYLDLNGKLVLYARRDCTDQLRTIHGVSVVEMTENERDGVYIVTAKVRNRDGRTDMAKGAVAIANLKGEFLANAMMKAETKAKRRATLSICGLGWLDETEADSVPGAQVVDPDKDDGKTPPADVPPPPPEKPARNWKAFDKGARDRLAWCESLRDLAKARKAISPHLPDYKEADPDAWAALVADIASKEGELRTKEAEPELNDSVEDIGRG